MTRNNIFPKIFRTKFYLIKRLFKITQLKDIKKEIYLRIVLDCQKAAFETRRYIAKLGLE